MPSKRKPPARAKGQTLPTDQTVRANDFDTESRILAAARIVFVRRGTAGARMQDIALEAGVNQALVHYYFGSKDELAERVFIDAASRVGPAMATLFSPTATLEEMIEGFVTHYIDIVRLTPFVPAYLMAEAHQHPDRLNRLVQKAVGTVPANVAANATGRLDKLIAERVAAGTLRYTSARQFLCNVLALVVMPFVGRAVVMMAFGLDDAGFDEFLDERRRELPGFILNALRP